MPVHKHDTHDLRERYPLYLEFGMIAALGLLILAFRIDWSPANHFEITTSEQEHILIEEIQQTEQVDQPPPPRPPVPVEVPNDAVLEDVPLDLDASLDLNEVLIATAPPPPPEPVEEETEPEIFVVVEEMPELIGGIGEIQRRINYPEMARRAGVEGRVIVQFVVNEEGRVIDPEVVRGIGAGCDEEALRAVSLARFVPGKQRGRAVKVRMSLPVHFRLR